MNSIFNRYKKNSEELLLYTAYLQCLPNNSSFIYRIQRVQNEMLIAFQKSKSVNLDMLDSILNYGSAEQSDDPQENLFVDSVHPAVCESKRVFSGLFLDDVELLTTILTSSCIGLKVDPSELNISLFLLECSDIICKRFGYKTYENGTPNSETPSLSSLADFNANKSKIILSSKEIYELCDKYNVSADALSKLTLHAKSKDIRKELEYHGYSPVVEVHPFYHKSDNSYLILSPSYLLHTACREAITTMTQLYGETFAKWLVQFINNEAGAILQRSMCYCFEQNILNGIPYMFLQFDSDKAVIMATSLSSEAGIATVQKDLENKLRSEHANIKVFHILIYVPLDESVIGLMPIERCICLKLDELRMLSNHHLFSLMNLFYYCQDREEQRFAPLSTDKDKLAFYFHEKCSFYRDEQPDLYWINADFAQIQKYEHAIHNNIHDIAIPGGGGFMRVAHYADIPKNVPIYSLYLYDDSDFILCELNNAKIYALRGACDQYFALYRELRICLMNWLYAIELKHNIQLFKEDLVLTIEVCEDGDVNVQQIGPNVYVINVPLKCFDNIEAIEIEPLFVKECCSQLVKHNVLNPQVTDDLLNIMFINIGNGRFLQIGYDPDPRTIKDKYDSSYELSERWCDKILTEIANHINRKGEEIQLSFEDGKLLLRDVISFLQEEAVKLIKQFDTEFLVENLLQLHHSVIYWSAISNARYQRLSHAYEWIDAVFENQQKYVNGYAEIKTLSQGIVEYIFMQSVSETNNDKGSSEMIDRLFALMHHIVDFGCCLDCLQKGIKGADIVLLANGRVVYPRPAIDISNRYFERLRSQIMEYPDKLKKLHHEIPDYSVDTSSDAFRSSFIAEFGFNYDKFILVIQKSIEYSDKINEPVVKIEEDIFKKDIITDILTAEEYISFRKNWILTSEQNMETLNNRDFFIQRFNRTTQFSTRPWILLNGCILFSTRIIAESLKIFHDRLSFSIYRGNSTQMKTFIKSTIDEKGKHFNKQLFNFYSSLNVPNLLLFSEEKIKPSARLAGPKDLGDIDLLLIQTDRKQIICIEAKNYYESRDVYSLLDQNENIKRHLSKAERRDKWCRENIIQFKKIYNGVDSSYCVKTIFLTYNEPSYRYFEHERKTDIPLMSALEIVSSPMTIFD